VTRCPSPVCLRADVFFLFFSQGVLPIIFGEILGTILQLFILNSRSHPSIQVAPPPVSNTLPRPYKKSPSSFSPVPSPPFFLRLIAVKNEHLPPLLFCKNCQSPPHPVISRINLRAPHLQKSPTFLLCWRKIAVESFTFPPPPTCCPRNRE